MVLEQDNLDYLWSLAGHLYRDMAMGISTYKVGSPNDIAGTCSSTCSDARQFISNIRWTEDDAYESTQSNTVEGGVDAGAAPSLTSGGCGSDCTECRSIANGSEISHQCVDTTVYKYGSVCPTSNANWSTDKCATDSNQLCFKSYPLGDPDKMNSD